MWQNLRVWTHIYNLALGLASDRIDHLYLGYNESVSVKIATLRLVHHD